MNEALPGLMVEGRAIAADARRTFGHLTGAQLNWKPRPDAWSVAQCFDHLITINSTYFPQLQAVADGSHAPSWRDRVPWIAGLFGSLILRVVQPASPRKLKAAAHVAPASSAIDGGIVDRFVAHQEDVLERMKRLGNPDASAAVIASPVAPIVFYSVLDAFRIIVAHERRHMAQAERVMNAPGFPAT